MKNYITLIRSCLVLFLIAFAGTVLISQSVESPFDPGSTSEEVFSWYTALYGAVITVITYLQGVLFKKSRWIPNTAVRYVLIAAVAAGLFLSMNWVNAIQVFVGFIGAAMVYDKILSPLGMKTPKPIAG